MGKAQPSAAQTRYRREWPGQSARPLFSVPWRRTGSARIDRARCGHLGMLPHQGPRRTPDGLTCV